MLSIEDGSVVTNDDEQNEEISAHFSETTLKKNSGDRWGLCLGKSWDKNMIASEWLSRLSPAEHVGLVLTRIHCEIDAVHRPR